MRKLGYIIDLDHLREIKKDIVPALFTEHQFRLIEKKALNKQMTPSERNEFSRAVSRKMKAILKAAKKDEKGVFIYGRENIIKERIEQAGRYLKELTRKFRGKHIIITGSFLYKKNYRDIDVFVISKYEKDEHYFEKFHISYFTEDIYSSLFMQSIKKMCISNKELGRYELKEKVNLDTFISLYQEVCSDIENRFAGIKQTLRDFLLQAAFIGKSPVPDSLNLNETIERILRIKKPKKAVQNIFINAVVFGISRKKAIREMKNMIDSYRKVAEEYKQHKDYYKDMLNSFNEVISIEG